MLIVPLEFSGGAACLGCNCRQNAHTALLSPLITSVAADTLGTDFGALSDSFAFRLNGYPVGHVAAACLALSLGRQFALFPVRALVEHEVCEIATIAFKGVAIVLSCFPRAGGLPSAHSCALV